MTPNNQQQTETPAIDRRAAKRAAKRYIDQQIRTMKKHGSLSKKFSQRRYLELVAQAERLVVTANRG